MQMSPATLARVLLALLLVTAAVRAEEVQVVAKRDAWAVYLHEAGGKRTCFAAAQPSLAEPTTAKRDPIFFYVTAWPREGVAGEVSVKVGYPLKKGSTVTVAIGASAFQLATKDDRAFVADGTEEQRLVAALRKGSTMTVAGVSERGTQTKDTYPLAGAGPALDRIAQGCS